jgi:hypothetical protein
VTPPIRRFSNPIIRLVLLIFSIRRAG